MASVTRAASHLSAEEVKQRLKHDSLALNNQVLVIQM
jgi:hypothetical protein